MNEDVDAGGRPQKQPDSEFIKAIEEAGIGDTKEVQNILKKNTGWDISRQQTLRRLDNLKDQGEIVKKGGGRGKSTTWMTNQVFKTVVSDDLFISAIEDLGGMQTTEEIAEEVDINHHATLRRLNKLEQEGRLKSRKSTGDGETFWMVTN